MAVDPDRVGSLYVNGPRGRRSGSAYLVGHGLILSAAHVVTSAGLGLGDKVEVLPHQGREWLHAEVAWLQPDEQQDAVLLQLHDPNTWLEPLRVMRWGSLPRSEPASVAAIGYPWAQERPDTTRATEHLVGFLTPPADEVTGLIAVHIVSSAPRERIGGGSPWAGMSGAALFAGHALVAIIIVDPTRYGPDRLQALPVAKLLEIGEFCEQLGVQPELVNVGSTWRLLFGSSPDQSLLLRSPYRPLPLGFDLQSDPYRLLDPQHKVAHLPGRETVVEGTVRWAIDTSTPLGIRTVSGSGGTGKTRVAAEVCVAMTGLGWDAGFADFTSPGGDMRTMLERPTMIVVDDADLHFRSAAKLARATVYSAVPVRILLISRDRAAWWKAFNSESENNANGFDQGDLQLDDHLLSAAQRTKLFRLAHQQFRQLLGLPPGADPDTDLTSPEFGSPLLIQLTALVAALSTSTNPVAEGSGSPRARVLRAALDREVSRWTENLHSEEPLAARERLVRRCVSAASLCSPADDLEDEYEIEQAGLELLRAVPELKNATEVKLLALVHWLHTLHRGDSYWNPLRPDPLCDQLLADLDILPHLSIGIAETALRAGDALSLSRLLTELTRASTASGGFARRALQRVLDSTQEAPGGKAS